MEQSRVEELEALLAEAIPQVVIGDSKNDRISLSDYRRNLAAARESYHPRLPFLVHDIELEIQDPNIQARALDFYEIFNLGPSVGGGRGASWSPSDVHEIQYREVSDSELEKAKLLYKRLMEIPQTTRDDLRVPLDRWTKSNGQRDPADRMIDLGIALESLYLNDMSNQGELGFRLAIRASWHLGKDQAHRAQLMKDFRKVYDWRSRAVHSGNLEAKKDKAASDPTKRDEFIKHAQELCSESIKKIIGEGNVPDWNAIVLGPS